MLSYTIPVGVLVETSVLVGGPVPISLTRATTNVYEVLG